MLKAGLTGTMGSGKSTVGRLLALRGAAVIDTDQLAREVTAPTTPGHAAVVSRFGPGVTGPDGSLDRRALASLVFTDQALLDQLEAIVHPLVGEALERRVEGMTGKAPLVVVEVPLLDERRRQRYGLGLVVLVRTSPALAARRAAQASGLSKEEVIARQRAQPGEGQRLALADRTINNDGDLADLEAEVGHLWAWLLSQGTGTMP